MALGKCVICDQEKDLNKDNQCADCLKELDQTINDHEKKWTRSDIRNISKIMDKKLIKNAKREARLKAEEEKELDNADQELFNADQHADQHANANTSVMRKVSFVVGGCALLWGCVKVYKQRFTSGS